MKFKCAKDILLAVFMRDNINLVDRTLPIERGGPHLHWWKLCGELQNVGDMLSSVVVEYVLDKYVHTKKERRKKETKKRHLYAIGSIIDGGYQNAVIWGSGLLRGEKKYWWKYLRKLDIRCVRGPKTRETLLDNGYSCPEIYGDPAILMPLIYPAKSNDKLYPYLVIPHHSFNTNSQHTLSPMTSDWRVFIDELLKSELVISSSLHGIILAEAYGIPAIFLNEHNMNTFKYEDYYYSTGRYEFPIATSVEEALTLIPAELPDIKSIQQSLLNSFPKDLWE